MHFIQLEVEHGETIKRHGVQKLADHAVESSSAAANRNAKAGRPAASTPHAEEANGQMH